MYIDFTPEHQALRKEIRDYYRELFTPELRAALDAEHEQMGGPVFREIVGRMGQDGWLGIGWPEEYGGQGRTPIEQFIFWDETYRARAPLRHHPGEHDRPDDHAVRHRRAEGASSCRPS